MAHFPNTPSFTGFNTPSRIEADIINLVHEGTIPRELNGAFYRVQPDPQFPSRLGDDIAFNGDGMITRFHIHDGQCDAWIHGGKLYALKEDSPALVMDPADPGYEQRTGFEKMRRESYQRQRKGLKGR